MKFLSICSGIEAASVAWEPLGWEAAAFSEIEPFPSAVLAHHYPDVPNLGDMLTLPERIRGGKAPAPDLLCGGTPCQAFSVAGNRRSLDDSRGNLSLTFCEIANAIDDVRAGRSEPACIVFWENVPGVLNTSDKAFGFFLGELAGESVPLVAAGGKWTNAGYVSGPKRAIAWRVLDAQYFGVAQRRRRVFLVASARDGFNPAEILFEREGVRRDFAPSRETGQEVAGTIAARFGISRNNHEECVATPTVIGNVEGGAATTLSSREYKGLSCGRDGMTSAAVVYEPVYAIQGSMIGRNDHAGPQGNGINADVCFTQNTTDRHAVVYEAIPIHDQATRFAGKRGDKQDGKGNGLGIGEPGAPMNTLTKGDRHAVAHAMVFDTTNITSPQNGSNPKPGDPCFTLAKGQHPPLLTHAIPLDLRNAGRDPEKYDAINRQGVGVGEEGDPSHTITSAFVHGVSAPPSMAVRRLTPVECERLQGFPDDYTNIPWRKQPTSPDGPRYKALGNSWAVPNVRWIGARIDNYLKGEVK
jgi:DNA (cytosine-5)-methyltransferase 1